MSREELSRLVNDVMSDPIMAQEAMAIQDQNAMEGYLASRGYELTKKELLDVWTMTAKVLAGHSVSMTQVKANIDTIRSEAMAAQK